MGHPDKVADQISDAILDHCLAADESQPSGVREPWSPPTWQSSPARSRPRQKLSREQVDKIIRNMVREIGYNRTHRSASRPRPCKLHIQLHAQSPDISMGVDVGGAGDQGMMFGFRVQGNEDTDAVADLSRRIA